MLIDWDNLPDGYDDISTRLQVDGWSVLNGKCPKGMPEAIWRSVTYARTISAVLVIASLLSLGMIIAIKTGLINTQSLQQIARDTMNGAIMLAAFASMLLMAIPYISIRHYLRRVNRDNGEICLTCGYHLTGLPTEHRCPECGTEYNLDETRETWRKIILSNIKPPRRRKRGQAPSCPIRPTPKPPREKGA